MTAKPVTKPLILFIAAGVPATVEALRTLQSSPYDVVFFTDAKSKMSDADKAAIATLTKDVIICDTTTPSAIQKCLQPYQDKLVAVTCRAENQIPIFQRVIPHLPYLRTPTTESLGWATDKIWMRRRFAAHNKKISPAYSLVSDTSPEALAKIARKVGFPAIVKPTGLAASRLVSIVYHEDELKSVLDKVFRHIRTAYKENGYQNEPQVLVEQFMEGDMYSIEGFVTSRGKTYFCPLVHVKTGRSIGFDDFFGYQQMTPTTLKPASVKAAEGVAAEAVHALGLRSTSVHIELLKTEDGWKIIELGPRIGGFRPDLYGLSYGINITLNDVLIRVPEKPVIPRKIKAHTVAMKFFAKKEGRLTQLLGIKKAQGLESFRSILVHKKVGDLCQFAKNGGNSVFNIILSNPDRSRLLADIRRLEQMIKIETA